MDRDIFNVDIAQTGVKEMVFLLGDFRENRDESVSTLSGLESRVIQMIVSLLEKWKLVKQLMTQLLWL